MPEEFGTVNLKQGSQTREIEMIRRHYRSHRESLMRLIGDAPTEYLASEYQRLITEIDIAVRKLDELEGRPSTSPGTTPTPTTISDTNPAIKPTTGAGTRPLVRPNEPAGATSYLPPAAPAVQSRIAIIVAAGIVVLAIIGWLIWRASSERRPTPSVVQPTTSINNSSPPAVTPAPAPAPQPVAQVLKVAPAAADYGTIHKGTRAVRPLTPTNAS